MQGAVSEHIDMVNKLGAEAFAVKSAEEIKAHIFDNSLVEFALKNEMEVR